MTNDQGNARIDELFRCHDRLLWIASVVDDGQLDPLAEHATLSVEVGHSALGTHLVTCSRPCHVAAQRRGQTGKDFGVSKRGGAERRSEYSDQRGEKRLHSLIPRTSAAIKVHSYLPPRCTARRTLDGVHPR